MNELFRVECRTNYLKYDVFNFFFSFFLGWYGSIFGFKCVFVFYEDRFDIYRKDKLFMSVPYSSVVQEKTIPLGTRALNICCIGIGRFPNEELYISIIRQKKEDRDKIYNIIKNNGKQ